MTSETMAGKVQTVLGPIDADRLGVTLTHEHLLWDPTDGFAPPAQAGLRDLYYRRIAPDAPGLAETLGRIRRDAAINLDNCRLLDLPAAIEGAMLFKQFGGQSIVDTTSLGSARDPVGLARIARATGLNIIMGGSYYIDSLHPPEVDALSEEELTERIVREVTEGAEGTGIKPGVIGEIGCTWPLTDNERKVLRASGRAQQITGAPLHIHPGRDEAAPSEILDILDEVGADLNNAIMGHIERTLFKLETLKQVAESGCYIEWDLLGNERSYYTDHVVIRDLPNDAMRMDQMTWLAAEGFGDRIVVAHDLAFKYQFIGNGGYGYHYILSRILPRMHERGFGDGLVRNIFIENPKSALAFSRPA